MKTGIKILIGCLAFLLPVGVYTAVGASQKPVYSQSFLAELPEKYSRLVEATDQKKIVFAAASSLPFGLRSDIVESELPGYKSINMGLYVPLKTKATLDLVAKHVSKGDIVVFAPEPVSDLYTAELAKEPLLEATETNPLILKEYSESDYENFLAASFGFHWNRIVANAQGVTYTSTAPYNKASFNGYGEIKVATPYLTMTTGYDSSLLIDYSTSLLNPAFLTYIANIKTRVEQAGASFYYSFSPLDALAFKGSDDNVQAFEGAIKEKLGDCLLTGIKDTVYESGYFYDTNFHLNDTGKIKHSVTLVNALKAKLGITTPTATVVPDPSGPDPSPKPYDGETDNTYEPDFTYEDVRGKLFIATVKAEYRNAEYFLLPTSHEGTTVVGVEGEAFLECTKLRLLRIPRNITSLQADALKGCTALERVEIYNSDPNTIAPPTGGVVSLFGTKTPKAKIYVPKDALSVYKSHYFWNTYSDLLEGM
ncbi:MAG: hypothetical protein BWY98_01003 [Tenericutes bacterium ADurb.BinA155]|jgi:hypothetical protein|nr:MAG: hypothetical protein BWY98_01003 [Tenericutes bacterium ADurb.BinA155]